MIICKKEQCTGCGLCQSICPNNAIDMVEDDHFFLHPVINHSKCIDCGLCTLRCPSNNNLVCNRNYEQKCYAAWSKNKKNRKQSTSGGFFSEVCIHFINSGGYVAGVVWSETFSPKFVLTNQIETLRKMRGSKYAQASTVNIYSRVKEKLDEGFNVLFCGTPCQCHAMRNFLPKDYSNLYLIDFVCHGVPSSRMLQDYIASFGNGHPTSLTLRKKKPYWDYSFVEIEFSKCKYSKLTIDDPYFNLFNFGFSLRHSCHDCKYTSLGRPADLTMADFWGYIPHTFKMRDYNKGVSLVLTNSPKGVTLFNSIKNSLIFENRDLSSSIQGNKCFKEPFKIDNKLERNFWDDYINNNSSFQDLEKKYVPQKYILPKDLWSRRLKNRLRWFFRK